MRYTITTFLTVLFGILFLPGCGGGHRPGPVVAPYVPIPIVAGTPVAHALTGAAGQTIATGLASAVLVLPDGAAGELTIAPITSGPAYPFAGASGMQITMPAGAHVQVRVTVPAGQAAHCYVFGALAGCIDDSNVPRTARWVPITDGTLADGVATFDLPTDPQSRLDRTTGDIVIGITPLKPDRITVIEQRMRGYIATALATLPATQRDAAMAQYEGAMVPSFGESSEREGSYYTGFGWYFPDRVVPYFGMRLSSSADIMQHEVGHYLNHLLAGSAGFRPILNLAPDENHAIGSIYGGRTTITEEYAYYVQYLLGDMVNGGKPDTGYWLASQLRKTPSQIDYPSVEGFGCSLMAALTRATADDMYDFASGTTKLKTNTPAGALTKGEVLAAYADGASKIDTLATALETRMKAKGQGPAFQVIAERLGWSYRATGHVLSDKLPAQGVKVTPILKVTRNNVTTTYTCTTATTDASGIYHLPRAFFGNAWLRIEYGSQSYEMPYTVDRTKSTIVTQTIPDITLGAGAVPTLNPLTPDTAMPGEVITITGSNFGAAKPLNAGVMFYQYGINATPSTTTSWTNTAIQVTVPATMDGPTKIQVMIGDTASNEIWIYCGDGQAWLTALKTYNIISIQAPHEQLPYFLASASAGRYNEITLEKASSYVDWQWPNFARNLTWNGNSFSGSLTADGSWPNYAYCKETLTISGTVDPVRWRLTEFTADLYEEDTATQQTLLMHMELQNVEGSNGMGVNATSVLFMNDFGGGPLDPNIDRPLVAYHYLKQERRMVDGTPTLVTLDEHNLTDSRFRPLMVAFRRTPTAALSRSRANSTANPISQLRKSR